MFISWLHAKEVRQNSLGLVLAGLSKDIYVYIEYINGLKYVKNPIAWK